MFSLICDFISPVLAQSIMRWMGIIISLFGIAIWIYFWRLKPSSRLGYMLMVVFYLVNVIIFNLVVQFGDLSVITLNIWSTAIRLQTIFSIIGAGVVLCLKNTRK